MEAHLMKHVAPHLLAVCSLAIAAAICYAAPLTKEQLLKMKAAGISDDVIIHTSRRSCFSSRR
jgi:hypothetical protein